MDHYSTTRRHTRKQDEVTAQLRRYVGKLSAKRREELMTRAATMPIGPRQELVHAVAGERCASAVAEALRQ